MEDVLLVCTTDGWFGEDQSVYYKLRGCAMKLPWLVISNDSDGDSSPPLLEKALKLALSLDIPLATVARAELL